MPRQGIGRFCQLSCLYNCEVIHLLAMPRDINCVANTAFNNYDPLPNLEAHQTSFHNQAAPFPWHPLEKNTSHETPEKISPLLFWLWTRREPRRSSPMEEAESKRTNCLLHIQDMIMRGLESPSWIRKICVVEYLKIYMEWEIEIQETWTMEKKCRSIGVRIPINDFF